MKDLAIAKEGLASFIPVVLLFDFAAAFPSVAHAWMFCVLKHIRIPKGLLVAIKLLYEDNQAFMACGDQLLWLYLIVSGVLQGCPLSGSLFVVTIDPLLALFKKKLEDTGLGRVRTCADDIGIALRELRHLGVIFELFHWFRKVSGLALKPRKCNMILTVCECSVGTLRTIRRWLQLWFPAWAGFQICDTAKYLGLYLGPQASKHQWKLPLDKFTNKYREMGRSGLPLGLVGPHFSSQILPVLGYIGQLVPPPADFSYKELHAAHKILSMPVALDLGAIFDMDRFGGVRLYRPVDYVRSAMMRAAAKTITEYDEQHKILCDLAVTGASLATRGSSAANESCIPDGWTGEAFASNLFWARRGLRLGADQHAVSISNAFSPDARGGREPQESRKSIQSKFYKLLQSFRQDVWPATLRRKLPGWLPGGIGDWVFSSALEDELSQLLKKAGMRVSVSVIKSWANAWTTSGRMDEEVTLPCILGCDGCEDALSHYICCDPLWTAVISSSKGREEQLQLSPLARLCLESPTLDRARQLTIAFSTYHALKLSHRDLVDACVSSGDFLSVQNKLMPLADAFAKDVMD